jgi:hypothetical protein
MFGPLCGGGRNSGGNGASARTKLLTSVQLGQCEPLASPGSGTSPPGARICGPCDVQITRGPSKSSAGCALFGGATAKSTLPSMATSASHPTAHLCLRNMPTRAPWAVLQRRSTDNVMLMQVVQDLIALLQHDRLRFFSYGSWLCENAGVLRRRRMRFSNARRLRLLARGSTCVTHQWATAEVSQTRRFLDFSCAATLHLHATTCRQRPRSDGRSGKRF